MVGGRISVMKQLLIILVAGFLWSNVGFADIQDVKNVLKKIKKMILECDVFAT